jgi:endonuclease/exonuclease/phosphatase family metal-dependent hydrolase
MPLKVTTWNIEHSSELITNTPSSDIQQRITRVRDTIVEIDPDILCIVEGPKGEQKIVDFCNNVLNNQWVPVLLKGVGDQIADKDRDYGHDMRGTQWMWFVVKPNVLPKCRIQEAIVWHSFVGSEDWMVNYWGKIKPESHDHYRHPQVLIYSVDSSNEVEFIGVHLKSKINLTSITRDNEGNLTGTYLETALKARVKLATEATNIRKYVGAKFDQLEEPAIVLLGDCNDGPGQDFFETNYLFFDLIQNLQGEVLLAEKYFNHALFDYSKDLRWTAKFGDPILNIPASQNPLLIDHILFSQPLVRGNFPMIINAKAGMVEHEAFERANAGSNSNTRSSDHRPVSCVLSDNPII